MTDDQPSDYTSTTVDMVLDPDGTIRPGHVMTPPAPPLDAPAVEAAKDCLSVAILHTPNILKALDKESPQLAVHDARVTAENLLARIITACYEIERKRVDGRSASSILYRKRIADLERCARAERLVREKLVKALRGSWWEIKHLDTHGRFTCVKAMEQQSNTVLAAAAELEKQDG